MKLLKFGILIILFCLGMAAVNQFNTLIHEEVHEAIAYNHGCLNVTKQINFYDNSWVMCEEYVSGRSEEVKNQKELLDSLNEIVGYNVITILFAMFVCTIMIVTAIMIKKW